MAYEKDCYTLSDKGTHLFRDDVDLIAHEFTDQLTLNSYSIILLDTKYSIESQLFFDYLFGEGISGTGDLLDLACNFGIIEKSGTWYSCGKDRMGQGREAARKFLEEKEKLSQTVREQVHQKIEEKAGE